MGHWITIQRVDVSCECYLSILNVKVIVTNKIFIQIPTTDDLKTIEHSKNAVHSEHKTMHLRYCNLCLLTISDLITCLYWTARVATISDFNSIG